MTRASPAFDLLSASDHFAWIVPCSPTRRPTTAQLPPSCRRDAAQFPPGFRQVPARFPPGSRHCRQLPPSCCCRPHAPSHCPVTGQLPSATARLLPSCLLVALCCSQLAPSLLPSLPPSCYQLPLSRRPAAAQQPPSHICATATRYPPRCRHIGAFCNSERWRVSVNVRERPRTSASIRECLRTYGCVNDV